MAINKNQKAVMLLRQAFADARKSKCGSQFWALVSAMRGPDSDNEELKNDTTAKLRSFVIPYNKTALYSGLRRPYTLIPEQDWFGQRLSLGERLSHFGEHFEEAKRIVKESGCKPILK